MANKLTSDLGLGAQEDSKVDGGNPFNNPKEIGEGEGGEDKEGNALQRCKSCKKLKIVDEWDAECGGSRGSWSVTLV